MKQVMVLRHAHAEWSAAAKGDHGRRLSEKGREAARTIGAYMARQGLAPARVLCSSAQRTRETLDLVLPDLNPPPEILIEEGLYGADEAALPGFVAACPQNEDSLLLIAHNPGIQGFALGLVSEVAEGVSSAPLTRGYPPGTLSVFSFDVDDWHDVVTHTGLLTHCHRPD